MVGSCSCCCQKRRIWFSSEKQTKIRIQNRLVVLSHYWDWCIFNEVRRTIFLCLMISIFALHVRSCSISLNCISVSRKISLLNCTELNWICTHIFLYSSISLLWVSMSSKSVWNRLCLKIQIMIVFRNSKFNRIWGMIIKRLTPSILIFKLVFYTYLAYRRGSMGSIFLDLLFSVVVNCIIAQAIYFRNCCYKIFSAYLLFCLNYVTCQLKHKIICLKNKWFFPNESKLLE